MVSPLKIWQHPQPRHLWPVLGGLSVLAHIGVIGLSLPYMLTLMQSSRGAASSSVVPIKLVTADDGTAPMTSDSEAVFESRYQQSQDSSEELASRSDVATSSEATTSSGTSINSLESAESQLDSADSTMREYNNRQSETRLSASIPPENRSPESRLPENIPSEGRSPESSPESSPDSRSSESSSSESDVEDNPQTSSESHNTAIPEDSSSGNFGEIPSIDDTGMPLDPPSEGTGDGNDTDQAVSLTILNAGEVPAEMDTAHIGRVDELPQLISDVNAMIWRTQSSGCGPVDFSQPTATYRMEVNEDGSLRDAILWTGESGGRSPTDSERAIACLLKSANLTFEPARHDEETIPSSSLLLTIKIVELPAE